mmetsp:Transcript_9671/g.21225  ORF Transcript_9671/g.21225 Transcript_9671/m.21225 type:complete len:482 (+) Transcript_9671:173-1618(+)|eukprot:CAMPEP_0206487282 /NCGR_PEP_ID=MMETSP0324_2-20121206/41531_1 /ASSEMBLY_ACC=CAM_ASM_000836 /TAXON_ID=2866 /ORGANISM="Crypthecodinium cohnii, Strain Seligo" /LENGTH=481 /DNA_ID=CAMNT_0053965699 /DNA_START=118 /DNA_END=1563 /DNA_ORIENTATION=+
MIDAAARRQRRHHLLGVCALGVSAFATCGDASLLFRSKDVDEHGRHDESSNGSGGGSSSSTSRGSVKGFESLSQCNAAYADLAARFDAVPAHEGPAWTPSGWQSRGGLVDDEKDNKLIIRSAPIDTVGDVLYHPPMSYTGFADPGGWDYRHHGEDWGKFGMCATAQHQSPIDFKRHVDVKGLTKSVLWFDYYVDPKLKPSSKALVINDGHGLRYRARDNGIDLGYVKVGSQEFTAAEYILHTPSEHTIDGATFPAELQIYNRARDGGYVAVGIFFREGESNDFLAALSTAAENTPPVWTLKAGRAVTRIEGSLQAAFDLERLIPKGDAAKERAFFNYNGSLTMPPCTEGVDWWVLSSPVSASRAELRFLRDAIFSSASSQHGNTRSTMPLGNRKVRSGLVGLQHAVKDRLFPGWATLDEATNPRGYSSGDIPWGSHWAESGPVPAPAPAPGPAPAPAEVPSGVASEEDDKEEDEEEEGGEA